MGIREYRGQILCDRRWPDGKGFKRAYPNRKQAENRLTRIEASILDGSWKKFRERLQLRNLNKITLREFSETYMQEFCRPRNKRKTCRRKKTSLNSLNVFMGSTDIASISPTLLHKYVQRRKAKGLSDASVNHDIVTLKHLLGYAVYACASEAREKMELNLSSSSDSSFRPRFSRYERVSSSHCL